MNTDLLKQLYAIHSPSNGEKKMRKFLKKVALSYGANVQQDKAGNLLITKGISDTYPCIAAHMDQVQKAHSKDFKAYEFDGAIMGYSQKAKEQQGLGADDKNGIFIALECLKKYDVLKVAFFVGEEVGCQGSSAVDLSFFDDCRFVVEADRRNAHDLITEIYDDLCSEEFLEAINYEKFGYKPTDGLSTDVGELKSRGLKISCINLSCGYYEPHTNHEFTVLEDLENALNFVMNIVENCTAVYTHVADPRPSRMSYYGGSSRAYARFWHDDWYGNNDKVSNEESLVSDYEDSQDFDDDCETMYWILEQEPHLNFDEVMYFYKEYFLCDDTDLLRGIYEDVRDTVLSDLEYLAS